MDRDFLQFPKIRFGGKHGQYFANAGPLYLRIIIICVLITLQGNIQRDPAQLEQYGNYRVRTWHETRYCSGRPSTHHIYSYLEAHITKKMWFCHRNPEDPALSAEKAYGSNLFVF